MIITDKEWVINFLKGEQCDYKGRVYKDILSCSDKEMEECHDQVQWIFPLHESSKHAMTYPILTPDIVKGLKDPKIIKNISDAIKKMSDFYGLEPLNREKQRTWCIAHNHNLLRVTRIVRSARFFGLDEEADDFYQKARNAGDYFDIGNVTKAYWWRARNEKLYETLR